VRCGGANTIQTRMSKQKEAGSGIPKDEAPCEACRNNGKCWAKRKTSLVGGWVGL